MCGWFYPKKRTRAGLLMKMFVLNFQLENHVDVCVCTSTTNFSCLIHKHKHCAIHISRTFIYLTQKIFSRCLQNAKIYVFGSSFFLRWWISLERHPFYTSFRNFIVFFFVHFFLSFSRSVCVVCYLDAAAAAVVFYLFEFFPSDVMKSVWALLLLFTGTKFVQYIFLCCFVFAFTVINSLIVCEYARATWYYAAIFFSLSLFLFLFFASLLCVHFRVNFQFFFAIHLSTIIFFCL